MQDAQREVRTVFIGDFLGSTCLVNNLAGISRFGMLGYSTCGYIHTLVIGGLFMFAITQLLRLTDGPASLTRGNPLHNLGMQIAFTLPPSMFLLVPLTEFRLNLCYPALMILLGAHYLPFTFLYGMRMFFPLDAILDAAALRLHITFPGHSVSVVGLAA